MNILLIALAAVICGGVIWIRPTEAPGALAFCVAASIPTIFILIRANAEERRFLLRIFLLAVLARIILATVVFVGHMEEFFGGDANTYDLFGQSLLQSWHGDAYHTARYEGFIRSGASAWGMLYLVAGAHDLR